MRIRSTVNFPFKLFEIFIKQKFLKKFVIKSYIFFFLHLKLYIFFFIIMIFDNILNIQKKINYNRTYKIYTGLIKKSPKIDPIKH